MNNVEQLRADALRIWQAGVDAVASERLVRESVRVDDHWLQVGPVREDLNAIGRIVVVGAGKAGAGMAAGLLEALGSEVIRRTQLTGWINVPEDCVRPLAHLHLHAARPPGVNEPTAEGVAGAEEILRLVGSLGPADVCIALVSGGGSALLPMPIEGIPLADKLAVTRWLSAAGAPIEDLNTVRKALSAIKGGKLARACRAGRLFTLIISDVLGDPLDLIASGPTVPSSTGPAEALAVLERYQAREPEISERVFEVLKRAQAVSNSTKAHAACEPTCEVRNFIIGNNAAAVAAAAREAERLGYATETQCAAKSEGPAEEVGRELAREALSMHRQGGRRCLITGGEPTVRLVEPGRRGLGGRNQQLVLAAAQVLEESGAPEGVALLSGGTDGEDGPTDAAGAWVDAELIAQAERAVLAISDYLGRNDAYHWFAATGGLIKTGPTHTNVCDVRVVLTAS